MGGRRIVQLINKHMTIVYKQGLYEARYKGARAVGVSYANAIGALVAKIIKK